MSLLLSSPSFVLRSMWDFGYSAFALLGGRLLPTLNIEAVDLTGKTAIVTGANSGIGLSLATSLARQGATVFLACRNIKKGEDAAAQIIDTVGGGDIGKRVQVVKLDTSDLTSVREFADAWKKRGSKIDILIHNAGITNPPSKDQNVTSEGLGMIYVTNFLGSFLLTSLLESSLAEDTRVIFTSSFGQYGGIPLVLLDNPGLLPHSTSRESDFYGTTKGMQVAFGKFLQQRWQRRPGNKRIAHSFSPGYTYTPIFDKISAAGLKFDPLYWALTTATLLATPVDTGAKTGLWLATTSDSAVAFPQNGGGYWDRCNRIISNVDYLEKAYPEKFAKLWDAWCRDSGAVWD